MKTQTTTTSSHLIPPAGIRSRRGTPSQTSGLGQLDLIPPNPTSSRIRWTADLSLQSDGNYNMCPGLGKKKWDQVISDLIPPNPTSSRIRYQMPVSRSEARLAKATRPQPNRDVKSEQEPNPKTSRRNGAKLKCS